MNFLPEFLLKTLRTTPGFDEDRGRMVIIIRRPYAYLEAEQRSVFEGQDDVEIIVDRRVSQQPVELERRQVGWRRPKEEILEVVISD